MRLWVIPTVYIVVSVVAAFVLPRLEQAYLAGYAHDVAVGSALAFFSAVGSGMIALTGVVFAIAFIVMQFRSVAYSPRLVVLIGSDPALFHTLGIFAATFIYSLAALVWTDRGGSGTVPLFSAVLVEVLLVASLLALVRLVQSISNLQIHSVLRVIGGRGRVVISTMFQPLSVADPRRPDDVAAFPDLGPVTQTLSYSGEPRAIARFDIEALVLLAQGANAVVVLECAVGDTLVEDTLLLRVHAATKPLPESSLLRAVRLSLVRTFEQDPKYALRLLVDVAIRALSPAINDPATAVQALDQIEDLMRRLGRRELEAGRAYDANGVLRLVFPMPTWEDYLALSFDEIRQYGAASLQVMRRLRSALTGLIESVPTEGRREAVRNYLEHLDLSVGRSIFDDQDREAALQEDRQGLGLSRGATRLYGAGVRSRR